MSENVISKQPSAKNTGKLPSNVAENVEMMSKNDNSVERIWMQAPHQVSNDIPADLQNLAILDEIRVDVNSGTEYEILNNELQNAYFGIDTDSSFISLHTLDFSIRDMDSNEIMHFYQPSTNYLLPCVCCSFSECCHVKMKVDIPRGIRVGTVSLSNVYIPSLIIKDQNHEKLYDISGPIVNSCCINFIFKVFKPNTDEEVAHIKARKTGLRRLFSTDPNQFIVVFLENLNVYHKALILAAGFFINDIFFDVPEVI